MSQTLVKLLDQVRSKIPLKSYSIRTEKSYIERIRRFILFHNKRYPKMDKAEIESLFSHLVVQRNVASSPQNQVFNAILFLYDHVLEVAIPENISIDTFKKASRTADHDDTGRDAQGDRRHKWGSQIDGENDARVLECFLKTLSVDPRTGIKRRHHMHESSIRKAIKQAAKISGIVSPNVS